MAGFLGLDLGTSGCRGCLIDAQARVVFEYGVPLSAPRANGARREQDPALWWNAAREVIERTRDHTGAIDAIAVDGTSGTVLVVDGAGRPLGPALMYDDARAHREAERIQAFAPPETAAHGPTSGLAKLMWLAADIDPASIYHVLSHSDWVSGCLLGRFGFSDENNALKLGYDPIRRRWPDWLERLGIRREWLPEVHPAGEPLAKVDPAVAEQLDLPAPPRLIAGTTDSIAGLIAAGAHHPGEAVTSLGTTLALKVLGTRPIFEPRYGVYSHRLRGQWLVGGASNSGGGVLRQFFADAELARLSARLNPARPTGLAYYPLSRPGERFPYADPGLRPRLTPRPTDRSRFLQGLLEGIAGIERQGYSRLHELGAPYPSRVYTVGGGATNTAWTAIRQQILGVEVTTPHRQDAAYGSALLARDGMVYPSHRPAPETDP